MGEVIATDIGIPPSAAENLATSIPVVFCHRRCPTLAASWLATLTETDIAKMYNMSATKADGTQTGLSLLLSHLTNVANEVCGCAGHVQS